VAVNELTEVARVVFPEEVSEREATRSFPEEDSAKTSEGEGVRKTEVG
jgi:hypothetical protein